MPAEADDRDVGVGLGNVFRLDPTDVRDYELGPIRTVDHDEVMAREQRFEFAPKVDIDPTQQDRGHDGSVPRLWTGC